MEKYYQYKGLRYYVNDVYISVPSIEAYLKEARSIDTMKGDKDNHHIYLGAIRNTTNEACIALEKYVDTQLSKGKKVIRKE